MRDSLHSCVLAALPPIVIQIDGRYEVIWRGIALHQVVQPLHKSLFSGRVSGDPTFTCVSRECIRIMSYEDRWEAKGLSDLPHPRLLAAIVAASVLMLVALDNYEVGSRVVNKVGASSITFYINGCIITKERVGRCVQRCFKSQLFLENTLPDGCDVAAIVAFAIGLDNAFETTGRASALDKVLFDIASVCFAVARSHAWTVDGDFMTFKDLAALSRRTNHTALHVRNAANTVQAGKARSCYFFA